MLARPPGALPGGLAAPPRRCYRPAMKRDTFQKVFLLALAGLVTWIFFRMVHGYLITLLLAAIFAAWATPLYDRFTRLFRGRRNAGAIVTVLLLFFAVLLPFLAFLGIVAGQALKVSQSVAPWVAHELQEPDRIDHWIANLPFSQDLGPYREEVYQKLGQMVSGMGSFLFNAVSAATRGTVSFFFHLFILLYSLFWFLRDGERLLRKALYYMPLGHEQEMRLTGRFVSVTRATLKGTLVIGIIQGGLAGLGFWVADIPSAVFWGTVMAVLSIIPAVGTPLVWIPAVIVLFAEGHVATALLLGLWCLLVVGSVDNFLRPRLVGHDTAMHDLLILLSTLGGLALFGVTGFIVGPVVAALFVTIWQIYGEEFKDLLPKVGSTHHIEEDPS